MKKKRGNARKRQVKPSILKTKLKETINGGQRIKLRSKKQTNVIKLSDADYIKGNYSIAQGMAKYIHKFGAKPWMATAEIEYNKTFGTNHFKLQQIVKDSNV